MIVEHNSADVLLRALILSTVAVCWAVTVVRVIGLRSFSKMTAFDFVVTVAIGSLLAGASQSTTWSAFLQANLAMVALLGVQFAVALLRRSSSRFDDIVQNEPVLLMIEGEVLTDALRATRVAEDDLIAKLRQANVHNLDEVRAVVLETTGDISVLHGSPLDDTLLRGVQRADYDVSGRLYGTQRSEAR